MKIIIKIGGQKINSLDDIINGQKIMQDKHNIKIMSDKKKIAEDSLIENAIMDE